MEKRLILAIVLSIAVLLLYQHYFMPEPPKGPATKAATGQTPASGNDNARTASPTAASGAPAAMAAPGAGAPLRQTPARTISVRTPLFTAMIDTAGGGLSSFRLARYPDVQGPGGKPLDIIGSGTTRPLPFDLSLGGSQPALPPVPVYASDAPGEVVVKPGEKKTVTLSWTSSGGIRIVRDYRFSADAYDFDVGAQVTNGTRETVRVAPGVELSQEFLGELSGDSYVFKGAVLGTRGGLERVDLKAIAKGKVGKTPVTWAAADSKYFALIVLPGKEWTLERLAPLGEQGLQMALGEAPATLSPGESVRFGFRAFAGPKEADLLKRTGKGLENLIDYGWFSFLAKPLVWLLDESHRMTRNYGLDIIFLTVLVKILFYPLTRKSLQSMKKMQDLAPILTKLREKYKDDKARLNQETMNLYKTYKINPFSGCLPMLLQIPVFIALYKALLVTIELRQSPFFLWITDLSAPEHLWDLTVAGYVIPIRLLPLLMGISMFIQQKMTPSGGMDPAQQKMMLLMPVIFTFMFWGFPTGLVIYWLVNNLLSIGQQVIHNRQAAAAQAASP
ncbi:MAG: membrane protein insertase YidC [Deltaproteobacteria bacterium]|nr:membrane protein insertase YidC [Deltaproteobacteria bacterium]